MLAICRPTEQMLHKPMPRHLICNNQSIRGRRGTDSPRVAVLSSVRDRWRILLNRWDRVCSLCSLGRIVLPKHGHRCCGVLQRAASIAHAAVRDPHSKCEPAAYSSLRNPCRSKQRRREGKYVCTTIPPPAHFRYTHHASDGGEQPCPAALPCKT